MTSIEITMDDLIEIPFDDPPVSAPPQVSKQPSRPPSRRPEESTLHWVCDVERAFLALLWHHPELLHLAKDELDFALHLSVPVYRQIIQAISIVHSEIGVDLDFHCVVHCVRELGAFEEAGGIEGLNEIYTDGGRCCEGYRYPEAFFREYAKLLKLYATTRQTDPFQSTRRYTGYGFLRKNKLATRPHDPAAFGPLRCPCCGHNLQLRGWPNGQELKLKAEPERK